MLIRFSLFFFIVFNFNTVFAQNRNLQSLVIGDQAAGMGGAYTSLFHDPSANAYYNPAGFAFSESTAVSASVGVYKKFDLQYNANRDFLTASFNMNQGFFRAIPASTSATYRDSELPFLADTTLAFSILVPQHEEFSGDVARGVDFVNRLSYRHESLWVGGSLAKKIDESSSLGISIFYTAHTSLVERSYRYEPTARYDFESRVNKANNAVVILGYQKSLNDENRIGLSLLLPSLKIAGFGERDLFNINNGSMLQEPQRQLPSSYAVPAQLNLGVSRKMSSDWLLSFDIRLNQALSQVDFIDAEFGDDYSLKSITNFSLGSAYQVFPSWEWRFGVFTDYSPHSSGLLSEGKGQADHIDQFGFSSNIAYRKKNLEYTFGGYYLGGAGHAWIRTPTQMERVDKITHIFTMLVGVQYSNN